jgi:D-arabinose 1-dehydrogenase-like Zn-dependent alcohol dehydrogenase
LKKEGLDSKASSLFFLQQIDMVLVPDLATMSTRGELETCLSLLRPFGKLILLSDFPTDIPIPAEALSSVNLTLVSNASPCPGSLKEIKETILFAASHGIKPKVQNVPLSAVNEWTQKVKEGVPDADWHIALLDIEPKDQSAV